MLIKYIIKNKGPPFHPRLNGDLDLKYFDANLTEENIDIEENLIVNSYGGTYLDKKNEKEKNKFQVFTGFSFYKEDDNINNITGEDSGMTSF